MKFVGYLLLFIIGCLLTWVMVLFVVYVLTSDVYIAVSTIIWAIIFLGPVMYLIFLDILRK